MTCDEYKAFFGDDAVAQLNDDARGVLRAHAASCAECRRLEEGAAEVESYLARREPAPAGLIERLIPPPAPAIPLRRELLRIAAGIAIAAAALYAAGDLRAPARALEHQWESISARVAETIVSGARPPDVTTVLQERNHETP